MKIILTTFSGWKRAEATSLEAVDENQARQEETPKTHVKTSHEGGHLASPISIVGFRDFVVRISAMAGYLVLLAINAYPNQMNAGSLESCATGNCAAIHGNNPQEGNALTATGKTDGGTYTPGETINLANAGGGDYCLYASSGGAQLALSNDNPTTVTAPASGELILLGKLR